MSENKALFGCNLCSFTGTAYELGLHLMREHRLDLNIVITALKIAAKKKKVKIDEDLKLLTVKAKELKGEKASLTPPGIIEKVEAPPEVKPVERKVLEIYDVNKPFAYVVIFMNPNTKEITYEVVEPTLSAEERRYLKILNELLVETLDATLSELGADDKAKSYLRSKIEELIRKHKLPIKENFDKIMYYIIRDFLGYGKIDPLMRDPYVEDISCSGVKIPIYVWHREYESIPTNIVFEDEEELDSLVIKLAYRSGKMISLARPILDATLPDGSRIQLTFSKQVTRHGSTFTIRKFKVDPLTIIDLIRFNTLSSEMAAYLWFCVENKVSIFVIGGVASGKTTMLNCLSNFIKPDLKIVTIEDTPEIQLHHKNWIRSVTRSGAKAEAAGEITLFDLLKAAVRQRPDYIIVGEIRGEEAFTLFQAMATGHLGMATMHAESVPAAIHRLESPPMNIPRSLIASLNIFTLQARVEIKGKPARRTLSITEVLGLDHRTNEVLVREVYKWNPALDKHEKVGESKVLRDIAVKLGKSLNDIERELANRKLVLEWMASMGMRSFKEVAEIIRTYAAAPDEVFKRVRGA